MPGGPLRSFKPTPVCLEWASAEKVLIVRSMTSADLGPGGDVFNAVNRLPGADLSANPADLGAGIKAGRDLQGRLAGRHA